MFKWLGKKFLGSELDQSLKGLRSLSMVTRGRTAFDIWQRIETGLDMLDKGSPLIEIQEGYRHLRRAAVLQATGYSDPTHLIASLPELFFVSISKSYPEHERVSVCRSISEALDTIFQQDCPTMLGAKDLKELRDTYSSFKRRLVNHKFI